jgi:hypothetical protein
MHKTLAIIILLALAGQINARENYQQPDDFIKEVFNDDVPDLKKLWLKSDLKNTIKEVLGHDMDVLRVSYWKSGSRTAWILDEIGRDHPITVGLVVNDGTLEQVKVLIFRESRGWEVRYPFFTDQFKQIGLIDNNKLSGHIDGITGATLSVIAIRKLARIALLFHQQVVE